MKLIERNPLQELVLIFYEKEKYSLIFTLEPMDNLIKSISMK